MSPKLGRPAISDSKRLQMRREIADVAKRLFQDEGYAKVTVRRIARELECSPMSLYKYYDSKIDILHTLWGDVFNDLFDRLKSVPKSDTQFQDLGKTYVRYWLEHSDYYRLVFVSDGVTQSDVSLFLDSPELLQHFAILSQALTSTEGIEPADVKLRLDAYICFLNGVAHNLITISDYPWPQADKLVDIAAKAITE